MNCTSFRGAIHEIDRDSLLEESAYDAAVAHAQTCTRCARLLSQSRHLDASLKALVRADSRCDTPARVYGQLLRAFREQAPSGLHAKRAAGWLAAAAAVLILTGGALLVRRHSPAPGAAAQAASGSAAAKALRSAPVSAGASGAATAALKPESGGAAQSAIAASPAKLRARKAVRESNRALQSSEFENMADFIPLPYADDDSPLGAGEMVRVRLSQSTLGLLGFPVTESRTSEPVTADLVIGEDGVARAIRFVSGPAPVELVQLQTTTSYSRGAKQP